MIAIYDDYRGIANVGARVSFSLLPKELNNINTEGFMSWEEEVKKVYPELGTAIGNLVAEKQLAYGDSFGKSGNIMRLLYPSGITIEQMDDALTIVRILDKLFRIATKKDAFSEEPYKDICGYGLLGWFRDEQTKKGKQ